MSGQLVVEGRCPLDMLPVTLRYTVYKAGESYRFELQGRYGHSDCIKKIGGIRNSSVRQLGEHRGNANFIEKEI